MKNFGLIFILIAATHFIKAQDLIVTNKGDSLNCRIFKVTGDSIYYTYSMKGAVRNYRTGKNFIKEYQKSFYPFSNLSSAPKRKEYYKKFAVDAFGGYSYMIAPLSNDIPPVFTEYFQQLKSGYHLGAEAFYFLNERIGLGAMYSMFNSQNALGNISETYPDGHVRYGSMSNNVTIQYVGPAFRAQYITDNKLYHFISCFSMGYLSYQDNAKLIDDYSLSGSTLGAYWSVGADYMLKSDWAIGLNFSLTAGSLSELEETSAGTTRVIKFDSNNQDGISRIDLSAVIRWYP